MNYATRQPRSVTRQELYDLVWQTPMSRLAEEFGVTGNGLAKACRRLNVPYPPRGYWAKKDAGKPLPVVELPPRAEGALEATDIYPTPPKPDPLPQVAETTSLVAQRLANLTVPMGLDALHPRVKAWINEHKQEQKERERESKRRDNWFARPLLADLTERDLYRFRVTSAIFEGVEQAGGNIGSTPITGKIIFLIDGHEVECSIVEKLERSLKPREVHQKWTAYPEHHQSGLTSSGHLRVTINTYVGEGKPQWVETEKESIGKRLPDVVAVIMAVGPVLTERNREAAEQEQRRREEEVRRYEARRQREIDDKRWGRFREYAAHWDERASLQNFLREIEARLANEGDVLVGDRLLSAWLDWARQHVDASDPLRNGAPAMFETISKVNQWS